MSEKAVTDMNKAELTKLAATMGLNTNPTLTKDDLVQAIQAHQANGSKPKAPQAAPSVVLPEEDAESALVADPAAHLAKLEAEAAQPPDTFEPVDEGSEPLFEGDPTPARETFQSQEAFQAATQQAGSRRRRAGVQDALVGSNPRMGRKHRHAPPVDKAKQDRLVRADEELVRVKATKDIPLTVIGGESYSFKEGQTYRVPRRVARHLAEKQVIV